MPCSPIQPGSDGSSEETRNPERRRKGGARDSYLNYSGQGGALLPGVLQHMRDDLSLAEGKPRPSDLERGRAADIKSIRDALARMRRAAGRRCRPLTTRFLFWLDRVLTDPSERNPPPPSSR